MPDTYNGYKITYTGRTGVRLKWDSTGYISSWPNVCTNWPWCPHYYSDGWYEWNTYYSYTNSHQAYLTKTSMDIGSKTLNGSSIVSTGSVSSSYGSDWW